MKKSRTALSAIFLLVTICLISGCSRQEAVGNVSPAQTDSTTQTPEAASTENDTGNPFQADLNNTMNLGSLGHGFVNPKLDETGKRLPLRYAGGELKIDYSVNASGAAKNVGFLIYINGIAQPYKTDAESSYSYMHVMNLEEDNKDYPLLIIFTPVTGKKGETLPITITSVYNPAFIPDMKETSGYGGYQTTLDCIDSIIFEQDAASLDSLPAQAVLQNVTQTTEPVTQTFLDTDLSTYHNVDMTTLDKRIYTKLYFDGNDVKFDSNLKVAQTGTLHVTYKMVGHPGVKYQSTLYLNHQALTDGQGVSFETTLTKGEISVLEADIDLSKIEDFSTFYVISTPCNADDFPEDVIVLEKTSSVLLYKE